MLEMFKLLKAENRCLIFKDNIFVTTLSLMSHVVKNWIIQNALLTKQRTLLI